MNQPIQYERTLVLGGGGAAGNAWLIGVIAGLAEAGSDVTDADLIIGTSAGSTAAAQIRSAQPGELLRSVLAEAQLHGEAAGAGGTRPAGEVATHLDRMARIIADAENQADYRRVIGATLAEDPASQGATSTRWRATVAQRFPNGPWPTRPILITAVDADTGEPVVFDRDSGVDLVDAVAASCAGGFAYAIGDRRYIDGGYRANADNADLAAGSGRALVLSPLGGSSLTPAAWGTHLETQIEELRTHGSTVETILPDSASRAAFGDNAMDPTTRPGAAQAGYEQGRAVAADIKEFWSALGEMS